MTDLSALEAVLRRDRVVVVTGLALVIALSWVWILLGAGTGMTATDMLPGPGKPGMAGMMVPAVWTAGYAGLMFAMWWVMMAAMMLPSAAPVLLLFARVSRNQKQGGRPFIPTGIFAAGYLAAWGGFSALAAGLQWALAHLGLLSPMMATTGDLLCGGILVAAGVWQLTPIKHICLRHCRSPLGFLMGNWRPGRLGAFRMGLAHGLYCLGCCWFLMGLLFFGGVMNLYWIAGLAAFVLFEKTIPLGSWIGRAAGIAFAVWGVSLIAAATLGSAATTDYRFEAAGVTAAGPGKTVVAVRLVHLPDRKPVADARIVAAKTDMAPSGMAAMSGKVTPLASTQPGLYRFSIETGMAGKWELVLKTTVPGEADPIGGRIVYDAK